MRAGLIPLRHRIRQAFRAAAPKEPGWLSALLLAAFLPVAAQGQGQAQSADSLPAFRNDSAAADPFRQVEAGQSPWSRAQAKLDTGFRADTVTAKLTRRRPAVSLWLGAEFSDLDAKDIFKADLAKRLAADSLESLQPFEEAHLSFPVGVQAVFPLGPWFDAVARARFSWYRQTAVLGHKDRSSAGEAWYAVQASLGGAGLRFYVPPSLLSVTGSLGLYAQFLWLWNLGASELYTRYGNARARIDPAGSGYELQFGLQRALRGPWQLAGSLGFVSQEYASDRNWSDLLRSAPPAGQVRWGSSSIQANLALSYHFGAPAADTSSAPAPDTMRPGAPPAAPAAPPPAN